LSPNTEKSSHAQNHSRAVEKRLEFAGFMASWTTIVPTIGGLRGIVNRLTTLWVGIAG